MESLTKLGGVTRAITGEGKDLKHRNIAPTTSLEDSMPTPESSLEALASRVAMLEAQNRRLKKAGIALLIVASASPKSPRTTSRK